MQRGLLWPCGRCLCTPARRTTASTTTDDIIAVYDDAAGLRCAEHQASAMSLEVTPAPGEVERHNARRTHDSGIVPFNLDHQPKAYMRSWAETFCLSSVSASRNQNYAADG